MKKATTEAFAVSVGSGGAPGKEDVDSGTATKALRFERHPTEPTTAWMKDAQTRRNQRDIYKQCQFFNKT